MINCRDAIAAKKICLLTHLFLCFQGCLEQALQRFLWAAQLKFDFDADKLIMKCKLCAKSLQSLFKLCAISEQTVCKHRHTDKNPSCCTSRVAFMAKTDMPSPVYCASVHKTSLLFKCTQNQFTVQMYTKSVYCISVHKTSLLYKCHKISFSTTVHKTSLLYKCTQNVWDGTLPTMITMCKLCANLLALV